MTIKTHGRMFTDNTVGITQLDITDGTANQALVTDGQGVMRFATVGAGGSVGSSVYIEDIRTGDGTTATFTLSTAAPYEESILVFIDGVAQPTSSFTLPSTTSITFSPAPGNGAAIRICHLGIASSVADNSITGAKIAMGGDTVGDVLYYNGTDYQRLTIGTALQVFRTNAATTAPEWVDPTTATLPATGADGNVLTSTGSAWVSETPLGGVGGELVSIQSFGASGTWTRPSGVKRIEVHLLGAGGTTWSDSGYTGNGAPGHGGGYCIQVYDVTDLASATVTIAAAPTVHPWTVVNSTFAGTGITTLVAGSGLMVNQSASGTGANANSGGAVMLTGSGGHGALAGGASQGLDGGDAAGNIGGSYGQGGDASGAGGGQSTGGSGYCYIKEYSDASASLVGEKLVATQLITTAGAGTWTRPAGVSKIEVWCVGGGGTGASGGGGGTAYLLLDVSAIASIAYVVGATDISSTFAQPAGTPGLIGQRGTNGAGGGTGGGASNGTINYIGESGAEGGGAALDFAQHGRGGRTAVAGNTGCIMIREYSDASLVSGGSLVPTGVVNPYAGATAPVGWLLCFGQAVSRTVYSTLFTAIGTTYGVGDGSTTFALPDMRGRVAAGQDDMGGTSANRLTSVGDLPHIDPIDGDILGDTGGGETPHLTTGSGSDVAAASTHAMQHGGSTQGFLMTGTKIQPTIILNYIIKT